MPDKPGELEEFVSEPLVPLAGTFDLAAMSRAEPGLPGVFTWRGTQYVVARLLSAWKTSGVAMGEVYLRRHWYEIETTSGVRMTVYCERQARKPTAGKGEVVGVYRAKVMRGLGALSVGLV